jgi:hypothetical protein
VLNFSAMLPNLTPLKTTDSQSSATLLLGRRKANLCTVHRAQCQRQTLSPLTRVTALHGLELLYHAYCNVARFRQRVLLTEADAWPAVERQVFPARAECLPPLRLVLIRIRTVKIMTAVHGVWGVADCGSFWYEKRCLTVWTTTSGQYRVADGQARVTGNDWVEAECWSRLVY